MTPFDPVALLAMLLAFYPIPSPAALVQARRDRPEYFAGGVLIGRSGDKMQLPDGRIWDLIFAVEGPFPPRRWIAIDVTDAVPGDGDGFELEPGPLTPIDEAMVIFGPDPQTFEALVAGELAALGASDTVLHRAAQDIIESGGGRELEDEYERTIVPAHQAHLGTRAALDRDDPLDELEAAHDHGHIINATSGEYDDDPPPDLVEEDPGDPPGDDDGEDGRPPREA